MRLLRFMTTRRALGLGLALVPAVACADGEERPGSTPPPDETPPAVIGDGGTSPEPDASEDAPITAVVDGCSDDGFCYELIPRSSPLIAVSASSVDDAWMLPESSGALYRWDGTSIKQVYEYEGATPPSITFTNVWAQTKDRVWAAARGSDNLLVLVRHASPPGGGAPTFRELRTDVAWTTGRAVWGTPDGNALWIANGPDILRVTEDENGAVVEPAPLTNPDEDPRGFVWNGVWGFGASDVYVAGKVCPARPCGSVSEGAIAHFDGEAWSITTVAETTELASFRGTPPSATTRQLWYMALSPAITWTTELASVSAAGVVGAAIYTRGTSELPNCTSAIGQAVGPTTGWFSDGLLLCRWTGTSMEAARTAVDSRVIVSNVRGIWADGADDAWVVGTAITRPGLPSAGFAARRTAKTARGEKP